MGLGLLETYSRIGAFNKVKHATIKKGDFSNVLVLLLLCKCKNAPHFILLCKVLPTEIHGGIQ